MVARPIEAIAQCSALKRLLMEAWLRYSTSVINSDIRMQSSLNDGSFQGNFQGSQELISKQRLGCIESYNFELEN